MPFSGLVNVGVTPDAEKITDSILRITHIPGTKKTHDNLRSTPGASVLPSLPAAGVVVLSRIEFIASQRSKRCPPISI